MKRLLIAIIMVYVIMFGFTYASKPLTPLQKRLQIVRQKKQVLVSTGNINTGCSISVVKMDFVPTTGDWANNISGASNQIDKGNKNLSLLKNNLPLCNNNYIEQYKIIGNNRQRLQSIIDINLYYMQFDKVKNMHIVYDRNKRIYDMCIEKAFTEDDKASCGMNPEVVLQEEEARLNNIINYIK